MGSAIACRVCLHSAAVMRVRPVARPGWAPESAGNPLARPVPVKDPTRTKLQGEDP